MNPEPHPPDLSDEQLTELLRQHPPRPSAEFEARFWQDFQQRLAQEPTPAPAPKRNKILAFPTAWIAIAATFTAILISFPLLQQLSQQPQAFDKTESRLEAVNDALPPPNQPMSPPMTLGAAVPEEGQQQAPSTAQRSRNQPTDNRPHKLQQPQAKEDSSAQNQAEQKPSGSLQAQSAADEQQKKQKQAAQQLAQHWQTLLGNLKGIDAEIVTSNATSLQIAVPQQQQKALEQQLKAAAISYSVQLRPDTASSSSADAKNSPSRDVLYTLQQPLSSK